MIRPLLLALLSMFVFEGTVFAGSGPVFSDTGPDAEDMALPGDIQCPPLNTRQAPGRILWSGRTVISTSCTRCAPFKNRQRRRS